jgi:hypothetical protein
VSLLPLAQYESLELIIVQTAVSVQVTPRVHQVNLLSERDTLLLKSRWLNNSEICLVSKLLAAIV